VNRPACLLRSSLIGVIVLTQLLSVVALQSLAGTYAGEIREVQPGDHGDDSGFVVIKQDGDKIVITAGPSLEEQLPGENVMQKGDRILFQVTVPTDPPAVLSFDVTVNEGRMTGRVSTDRKGRGVTGTLDFVRR
jgi:hypothetical protein